jgi:hypothetical protein
MRSRQAGQTRAARRWADHEPKTLSQKRAANRERQARFRERGAIVERNTEKLAARPEVVKIEPKRFSGEIQEGERGLHEAGWRMKDLKPDGSERLWHPPAIAPATVVPSSPAKPETVKREPAALVKAVMDSLEDEDLATLKESVSWPKTQADIDALFSRFNFTYDTLQARAFKTIDAVRAEKAPDAILDV